MSWLLLRLLLLLLCLTCAPCSASCHTTAQLSRSVSVRSTSTGSAGPAPIST
ncbi:hypothetical protein PF005_g19317 [Phytophthora fragariae]|uniref:RxLR effector protein n=1 Tax=Phytophthora fragariae TaxID=53985 RepID=A0A6A4CJH1_9STRA|nr:hypothetical protein PF003_g39844 [Phytophthora fragariae]KAE8929384.1 hypothetical protein PF009_g20496 [Phytophthora fragariae]KAE8990266.1 hypothetical protein PF011_g18426 [Phytophthora fragariae]KAE9089707.1 hypothetical protein PF010_g18883 [Phytophthora fragariae]KAE9090860.1 hypothetical protein PF007_g19085 [Phytophthora fragariae]